jgi:branched-chain amino acid transport system permease protein
MRAKAHRWLISIALLSFLVFTPQVLGFLGLSARQTAFWLALLTQIFIWGLFAMSYDLLFGYTGLLSLGHAIFFGLGIYGVILSILYWGFSPWEALGMGFVVAILGAAIIGAIAVRIPGHGFLIVTAVLSLIVFLLVDAESGWTGGTNGITVQLPQLDFGLFHLSLFDPRESYLLALGVLICAYAVLRWLTRSPLGRALVLIRENKPRADSLGYPTLRLKFIAFVISGTFAGLAGLLYALINQFAEAKLLDWTVSANALIWTLIGGAGTLSGPLLGTGLLKLLEYGLGGWWPQGYPLLIGLLLLVIAIAAPRGLLGALRVLRTLRVSFIKGIQG